MLKLYILMFLIYFNQGFHSLPSQSISYLLKETWHLTVTQISLLGTVCSIPWFGKILYGMISDFFPIFGYHRKSYLCLNYLVMVLTGLYVYFFGFTIVSYIIVGLLCSFNIAFCDVVADGVMVQTGQKFNITGKLQAIQWSAIDIVAILLGITGGLIAQYFTYQQAYLFTIFLPALTFIYLLKTYKEDKKTEKVNPQFISQLKVGFRDKRLWFALLFLFLLYFCPSFGTALFFKERDVLGFSKIFIGWLGTISATSSLVGTIIYFKICKKVKIKKLLFWATLINALLTFAYLWYDSRIIAIIFAVLLNPFYAFSHLTILDFCAKITPKSCEGTVFAAIMGILNLSSSGSMLLGGYLYQFIGLQWLIVVSGITTLICLPLIKFIKLDSGVAPGLPRLTQTQ